MIFDGWDLLFACLIGMAITTALLKGDDLFEAIAAWRRRRNDRNLRRAWAKLDEITGSARRDRS